MGTDFQNSNRIELLAPGVHAVNGFVHSARSAAERAVDLASKAAKNGTFGVGGLLIHNSGNILAEAVNSVIRSGYVFDPTAHVERQLVDWYFWARRQGLALPANELTIVSSVDPCVMCTGAILRSGMNAIALAEDKMSGVHGDFTPHRIPKDLWRQAEEHLALFAVRGLHRQQNGKLPKNLDDEVPLELLTKAEQVFKTSLVGAQSLIFNGSSTSKEKVGNSFESIASAIRQLSPEYDQRLTIPATIIDVKHKDCRQNVADLLIDDACALIDDDGHVMFSACTAEELSPARTSVLELVRAYTALRRDLTQRFHIALPHPRDCSVLKAKADPQTAKLLLEIGALGSFVEGPRQTNQMPFLGLLNNTDVERVRSVIHSLPPLYSEVIQLDTGSIFPS